jgi:hypothetical protein
VIFDGLSCSGFGHDGKVSSRGFEWAAEPLVRYLPDVRTTERDEWSLTTRNFDTSSQRTLIRRKPRFFPSCSATKWQGIFQRQRIGIRVSGTIPTSTRRTTERDEWNFDTSSQRTLIRRKPRFFPIGAVVLGRSTTVEICAHHRVNKPANQNAETHRMPISLINDYPQRGMHHVQQSKNFLVLCQFVVKQASNQAKLLYTQSQHVIAYLLLEIAELQRKNKKLGD